MLIPTLLSLALSSSLAAALNPSARWGHQAVYVPSEAAMYVIGGQVQTPGTQITNEVLVLPLNSTNPSYRSGPSTSLTPHAFAAAAISRDSSSIVVIGGLTSDCSADPLAHSLPVGNHAEGVWQHAKPSGLVRRRGAGMGTFDDGSSIGKMMLIGGISDEYSCAPSTSAFAAADVLDVPININSVVSTRNLPSDLTGSSLAVSDFALASSPSGDSIYIIGGQTSSGDLVTMDTVGIWSKSGGWTSQKLGGTIPVGRLGATLVAHPSLDMLILHGGARNDRGSDVSTTLLAFINTTTWEWSIPSHLQPPQSSAASYHSAIMTPHGVMISAFGLSSSGSPRTDTYYLDMRDPSKDAWTWKGQWSASMLQPYTASATHDNGSDADKAATGSGASSNNGTGSKKLASIVAPIVILSVLILPIAIYLIRRQVRINRKRRMARYFSFSSGEDNGEFNRSSTEGGGGLASKFAWLRRGSSSTDTNEKQVSWFQDVQSSAAGLLARMTGKDSRESGQTHTRTRSTGGIGKGMKKIKGEKNMNWEEIDFGLGRVDASRRPSEQIQLSSSSRRSSFSATSSPPGAHGPFADTPSGPPMAMANGVTYRPPPVHVWAPEEESGLPYINSAHTGTGAYSVDPFSDPTTDSPLVVSINDHARQINANGYSSNQLVPIPSLVVLPPTAHPTPAEQSTASFPVPRPHSPSGSQSGNGITSADPFANPPDAIPISLPATAPAPAQSAPELDWEALQRELDTRPAFRSISPTSTLRSHQAGHQGIGMDIPRRPSLTIATPASPAPAGARGTSPTPSYISRVGADAPAIPPLEFQGQGNGQAPARRQSSASVASVNSTHTAGSAASYGTITLVNPRTGRRTSEVVALPFSQPQQQPQQQQQQQQQQGRSVSSPLTPLTTRHLAGTSSSVAASPTSIASPGSVSTGYGSPNISTAVRFDPASSLPRRASGPAYVPTYTPPGPPSGHSAASLSGRQRGPVSMLRVVNPSESDNEDETEVAGRAI